MRYCSSRVGPFYGERTDDKGCGEYETREEVNYYHSRRLKRRKEERKPCTALGMTRFIFVVLVACPLFTWRTGIK